MESFTITSRKIIVTDPSCWVQEEGISQNIITNVMNGKWINMSENTDVICTIHENYAEPLLNWTECDVPCSINMNSIGVYDLEKYKEYYDLYFKNDERKVFLHNYQLFGFTWQLEESKIIPIQIGYNEDGVVCGVRDACNISYYCDNCKEDILDARYCCTNCTNFDFCQECFDDQDKRSEHSLLHTFKKMTIDPLV